MMNDALGGKRSTDVQAQQQGNWRQARCSWRTRYSEGRTYEYFVVFFFFCCNISYWRVLIRRETCKYVYNKYWIDKIGFKRSGSGVKTNKIREASSLVFEDGSDLCTWDRCLLHLQASRILARPPKPWKQVHVYINCQHFLHQFATVNGPRRMCGICNLALHQSCSSLAITCCD